MHVRPGVPAGYIGCRHSPVRSVNCILRSIPTAAFATPGAPPCAGLFLVRAFPSSLISVCALPQKGLAFSLNIGTKYIKTGGTKVATSKFEAPG